MKKQPCNGLAPLRLYPLEAPEVRLADRLEQSKQDTLTMNDEDDDGWMQQEQCLEQQWREEQAR